MTYRDLHTALARLSADPRLHPNTPVTLELIPEDSYNPSTETADLAAVTIDESSGTRTLTLSALKRKNALAR